MEISGLEERKAFLWGLEKHKALTRDFGCGSRVADHAIPETCSGFILPTEAGKIALQPPKGFKT